MIEYGTGSILESNAIGLVNPVNCVGAMGAGLAADFKREFPRNYQAYRFACAGKRMCVGRVFVTWEFEAGHYIANFPTKDHWRNDSKLEWIKSGLVSLVAEVEARDIKSIAIPALGCGLGGLKWADVRPLIEEAAGKMPNVRVIVFPPTEK